MTDDETIPKAGPGSEQVNLALDRTYLAHERTLMAWVRTSTSLITFGFTLYKFFQYVREHEQTEPPNRILGPRLYGMIMIATGIGVLAMATLQHRQSLKRLGARYAAAPFSLSMALAGLISGLGILAFIAALLRQ